MSKGTRYLLAAVQVIVGYEWLVSGANKVLSGAFPQGLADALSEGLKDNPNVWYVNFIQQVVLPHSIFFGTLIQYCELLAGFALLAGALVLCGPLPRRGERLHRLAAFELGAAAMAALICMALCVNFHFWMGDGLISGVNTAKPFDEGIDLDTLLPPLSLLIAAFNGYLLLVLTRRDRVVARIGRLFKAVDAGDLRDLGSVPAQTAPARTAHQSVSTGADSSSSWGGHSAPQLPVA